MNDFIFEGILREMTPVNSFVLRDGTEHSERLLVAETEEAYSQKLAIKVYDDRCNIAFETGSKYRFHLRFSCKSGEKGLFNSVVAWKIEAL